MNAIPAFSFTGHSLASKNVFAFRFSVLLCALVIGTTAAHAATYYLDPVNGLDTNVGSAAAPWKTMTKVESASQSTDTIVIATDAINNSLTIAVFESFTWPNRTFQAQAITQWGITWTFIQNYNIGKFANGDFWVVGPITITNFNPSSITSSGRIINGSMINPTVALGNSQGYDDALDTYSAGLNVAYGVSAASPLTVPVASSLISSISAVPLAKQKLKTAAVLTVLNAAPTYGSFRPPYLGTDKSIKFNASMLRTSLLPKLAPVNNTPSLTTVERMFERVWLFHRPGWTITYLVPTDNSPDYGRDICVNMGIGAMSLLLNYSDEQKTSLLKKYVQVGIDFYRYVENNAYNYWAPDGGINSGRKLSIIFAGYMLNDSAMLNIGNLATNQFYFQEDAQTFYVDQANIGQYFTDPFSNPARTHIYGADPESIPNDTVGYTAAHVGLPEWGIKHETDFYEGNSRLAYDRVRYGANYRDVNGYSWCGYVLPIHILGLKSVWNHNALFDYMDRYMAATAAGGEWAGGWRAMDAFSVNMWDAYRANYGPVWPNTAPADSVPPLPPTSLTNPAKTQTTINLSWTAPVAASDGDLAVSYKIYRNSSLLGTALTTTYADSGLSPGTSYTYQIFSVDDAGNVSTTAPSITVTTTSDTTPPTIASLTATSAVTVAFSESLDTASATNTANYSITPGITISAAALAADLKTVTLTTSLHQENTQYTLTVNGVKDIAGNSATNLTYTYTFNNGLASRWLFSETSGTTTADSSGNNLTASIINSPNASLTYGGAALFQNTTGAVQIPTTGMSPSAGTIAFWTNISGTLASSTYFFGHTVGSWSNRIQIYCANQILGVGLGTSHATNTNVATLNFNTWYHIALTWDGTNYAVYLNGTLAASGTYSGLTSLASTADIGNDGNASVRTEAINGYIDDVRIYNNALSPAYVAAIYQNNSPPTANAGADQTVTQGATVTLNASASSDSNNNISNYLWYEGSTLLAQTATATISSLTVGTHTINLYVKDAGGLMGTDSLTVTVNAAGGSNQAPVAAAQSKTLNEDTPTTVTLTATDADGNSLTYSVVSQPAHGTLSGSAPSLTYTPAANYYGSDSFTFKANDGTVDSNTATVSITITAVNDAPVLASIGSKSVQESSLLTFTVSATDIEGSALTYSVTNLPSGATFTNRVFSWTPTTSQSGTYSPTFTVSDGSLTASETVTITVTNLNLAPVLNTIGAKSVNENATLTFALSATDPDGDTISYWAENLPSGATLTGSTFSWTPGYTAAGSYNVIFHATDGSLDDSETVAITVNNVNRAPQLAAVAAQSINENTTLLFTVTATDPDGDTISYSAANLPTGATFTNRIFTWTPTYAQSGSYSVTITATDTGNLQDSKTVSITVNNVNRIPVLTAIGNKSVAENVNFSFTVTASDPDGDTITYSAVNLPTGATFNNRVFSWTPTYSQAGNYLVTFRAADQTLTASETITITVGDVNQPPVLSNIGAKSVNENATLAFSVSASDPDNDTITYSAQNLPTGATFSGQNFSWTPTYSQAGTYNVTIIASDSHQQDTETFTITVNNVGRPPVINSLINRTIPENQALTFTADLSDPDGDAVTLTVQPMPSGATLNDRLFAWTPSYSQAGSYPLTFIASDGSLQTTQTITITVTNVNQPPVLTPLSNKSTTPNTAVSFAVSASDPDGDTITYSTGTLPTGATFTNKTFNWTPQYAQIGQHQVTIIASDSVAQVQETVVITVSDNNHTPIITAVGNKSISENQRLTFSITASDADGDILTYSAQNLPSGATFTNHIFDWTPGYDKAGSYSVIFLASDGKSQDSQTVAITVLNVNRAPALAAIGNKSVQAKTALTFTVSATDPDGENISYTAYNLPSGATFAGNKFTWTPADNQVGAYNPTFIASDGSATDSQTITIVVTAAPQNQPPVFTTIGNKSVNENQTLTFTVSATDPENDPITYSVDNLPAGATFINRTFTWQPNYTNAGIYTLNFLAADGTSQASETVVITVVNVNRPPVLNAIGNKSAQFNTLLSFNVTASDPDGDPVTIIAANLPSGAVFENGSFRWIPSQTQTTSYQTIFTASDGSLTASETVTITIAAQSQDVTPPAVSNITPAVSATQVPTNSLVIVNVTDDGKGVDPASVVIKINNKTVYQGNVGTFTSGIGKCRRKGKADSYIYTFQPTAAFATDQSVPVAVNASDLAGNAMTTFNTAFNTVSYTLTQDMPVSVVSNNVLQAKPAAAVAPNGDIWVAWEVGPVGNRDIYVNVKSAQTGSFNDTPTKITGGNADFCSPAVAVAPNGAIYLAWQDNRAGNWDIFVGTSPDGSTWDPETRITTSTADQVNPVLAIDSTGKAWLAWEDNASGNWDIIAAFSSDKFTSGGGLAITSAPSDQTQSALAFDADNNLYVVWTDQRSGSKDLYAASAKNNFVNTPLVTTAADQSQPALAFEPAANTFHLAWTDNTRGNNDIFYAPFTSINSPLTGHNIIDESSAADQSAPRIVVAQSHVFACWSDQRNTSASPDNIDVYFTEVKSSAGTNITVSDASNIAAQSQPVMAVNTNNEPFIIWIDQRNAANDIYYSELFSINGTLIAAADVTTDSGGLVGTPPSQIDSLDDVSVQIPAGAFWSDVYLTITQVKDIKAASSSLFVAAYEFGPSSTMEFAQPVTITLPYAVTTPDSPNAEVYWYNPNTNSYSQSGISNVQTLTLSPTLRAIQFKTTHFSQYCLRSPKSKP